MALPEFHGLKFYAAKTVVKMPWRQFGTPVAFSESDYFILLSRLAEVSAGQVSSPNRRENDEIHFEL